MTAPMLEIDEDVARAAHAAYKAKCLEVMTSGQRLLAKIRPTSKYFGQGEEGGRFPVVVAPQGEYVIVGGPGGQYRLVDVACSPSSPTMNSRSKSLSTDRRSSGNHHDPYPRSRGLGPLPRSADPA